MPVRWDLFPNLTKGNKAIGLATVVLPATALITAVGPMQCEIGAGQRTSFTPVVLRAVESTALPAVQPPFVSWKYSGGATFEEVVNNTVPGDDADSAFAIAGTFTQPVGWVGNSVAALEIPGGSLGVPPFAVIEEVRMVVDAAWATSHSNSTTLALVMIFPDNKLWVDSISFAFKPGESGFGRINKATYRLIRETFPGGPDRPWEFSDFDEDVVIFFSTPAGTPAYDPPVVTDAFRFLYLYEFAVEVAGFIETNTPHGTVMEPHVHTVRLPIAPSKVTMPARPQAIEPPREGVEVCPDE